MKWAIIATIAQQVQIGSLDQGWVWTEVQPGTIINLIVYDGISPYIPEFGSKLEQVPDSAQIGDTGY